MGSAKSELGGHTQKGLCLRFLWLVVVQFHNDSANTGGPFFPITESFIISGVHANPFHCETKIWTPSFIFGFPAENMFWCTYASFDLSSRHGTFWVYPGVNSIWLKWEGIQLQTSMCDVDQGATDDTKLMRVFINFYKCAWVVHNLVKHSESMLNLGWMKQITTLILEVSLYLLILLPTFNRPLYWIKFNRS